MAALKNTHRFIYFLLLCLVIGQHSSYAQNEANIWWFGNKAGLDFNTNPPTVLNTTIPIFTYEGSATISDPVTGQLIFATDGITVWYPNGTVVPGGSGLRGNFSSAQSALIVPNPSNINQWFIFTANVNPPNGTPYGHNYYVVTRTGSTLAVGSVNALLGPTVSTEQLAALGDGVGGYWIMAHGVGNNTFYGFHVTVSGVVNTTAVTSNVGTAVSATDFISSMKVNSCQTKLALTNLGAGIVEVFNFDNTSGSVTSLQYSKTAISNPYGLEFSPNDAYLYYGTLGGQLYQLNMSTGVSTLTGWSPPPNGIGNFGQLQLAPDRKIYVTSENTATNSYLGVISDPDSIYTKANYSNTGLQIASVNSYYPLLGLPTFSRTFVSSTLTAFPGSSAYCINTNIPLSYSFSGAVTSQTWTVSPATGWSFTSGVNTDTSPTIRFTANNTYTVQLDVVSCTRTYTKIMTFTISAPLTAGGSVSCTAPNLILDNTGVDPNEPLYLWYDGPKPTGKLIGVGTPVNYAVGNDASKPANVFVEVATAASASATASGTVGPTAAAFTWSAIALSGGYTSPAINVFTDILVLKSFDIKPRAGFCSGTLTVAIKNGAGATIFTGTYTPTCVGGIFTIPVNATLPKGSGYKITLTSPTMQLDGNPSATTVFSNAQASIGASAAAGLEIANLVYDYQNFTTTTTCSNRTAVSVLCSLPVELVEFNGKHQGHDIRLYWSTASEKNNSHFDVERSADGIHFTIIGRVTGALNSAALNTYELYDTQPLQGINYYRLAQYDLDGTRHNSHIIAIYQNDLSEELFTVVPNPSSNYFTLILHADFKNTSLTITDAVGKIVYSAKIETGVNSVDIGEFLAKGIYILHLTTSTQTESKLIIKE
ncbi:MAG: T9SS type A sorting domain-containing protein [Cytophagaceae bacterium]|nr:T9SS type A sorting domain-containing protein [Cytophagaceae bacterium]